jgi:hypothetical protein
LAGAIERNVGFAGLVIGAIAEDLNDNIRGAKDLGSVSGYFRAFRGVLGVGIAGF